MQDYKESPLFQAVEFPENSPMLQILLQHPDIDLSIKNRFNKTAADVVIEKANSDSGCYSPSERMKFYQFAQMLKSANIPSNVLLNPLPSYEIMQQQYQNKPRMRLLYF